MEECAFAECNKLVHENEVLNERYEKHDNFVSGRT
jgi:hypothetical protein